MSPINQKLLLLCLALSTIVNLYMFLGINERIYSAVTSTSSLPPPTTSLPPKSTFLPKSTPKAPFLPKTPPKPYVLPPNPPKTTFLLPQNPTKTRFLPKITPKTHFLPKITPKPQISHSFNSAQLSLTRRMLIDHSPPCTLTQSTEKSPVSSPFLLIFVISSPNHFEARQAIRSTWGEVARNLSLPLYFLLGATPLHETQQAIIEENHAHQDILQSGFTDTYYNLTLKSLSMMHWISTQITSNPSCSRQFMYILKVDDDMLINLSAIYSFLNRKLISQSSRTENPRHFIGHLASHFKPIRNQTNKYYVSPSTFPRAVYPDFVTGPAYLFTTNIAKSILEAAGKAPENIFFLEDVYLSGILAQRLGIARINHRAFANTPVRLNRRNFANIWTSHKLLPAAIRFRWRIVTAKYGKNSFVFKNTKIRIKN